MVGILAIGQEVADESSGIPEDPNVSVNLPLCRGYLLNFPNCGYFCIDERQIIC